MIKSRRKYVYWGLAIFVAISTVVAEFWRRHHSVRIANEVQTRRSLHQLWYYAARTICEGRIDGNSKNLEIDLELSRPQYPRKPNEVDLFGPVGTVDAWNRPIQLIRTERPGVWELRSSGANGEDDGGACDDIVLEVDVEMSTCGSLP